MNFYDAIGSIASTLGVNYIYGSFKEIQLRLVSQLKNQDSTRYPAICLVTPFTQTDSNPLTFSSKKAEPVEIILLDRTKKTYSTPQRVTNVYTPVLWPLYENFKSEVNNSRNIALIGDITDYVDFFYYSSSFAYEQNKLAAALDAITFKINIELLKTC